MSRSTKAVALVLTLVVGALVTVSPLCLTPECAQAMAADGAEMASCASDVGPQIHGACVQERPRAVSGTADRVTPDLPDSGQLWAAEDMPVPVRTVIVHAVEPPPPDPLGDSSRFRV